MAHPRNLLQINEDLRGIRMSFATLIQRLIAVASIVITGASGAYAQQAKEVIGHAEPWQLGMQPASSPVLERLAGFHDLLLVIITVTTLFVLALMVYVCFRFREKANPNPSKTSHNTLIEIIWTALPVVILVAIAIPSLRHLYYIDRIAPEDADMTLKVVGYQWYWNYEYPDQGGLSFDSYMLKEEDLKAERGDIRLLSVDNPLVVPVNKRIRVLITGADVIHSWAMPSFGVKTDAVPGTLNETWFEAKTPGIYYGQCSELCGVGHGFMPIEIHAVSEEEFKAWVETAKEKFALGNNAPTHLASVR